MHPSCRSENGQIIVVFVVALAAILALTALAIDGGLTMSDRRYAQAAADAAALGGAGAAAVQIENAQVTYTNFSCSSDAVSEAMAAASQGAINAAAANNFPGLNNDDDSNPDNEMHGIEVVCVDDPAHFDRHIDVIATLTTESAGSFTQLFNNGPLSNTVTAVVRVRPPTPLAMGNAIVAFSPQPGNKRGGLSFQGNAVLHVTDGGMFSNAQIVAVGSNDVWVHDDQGDVMSGSVACLEDCDINSDDFDPDPIDLCAQADNCPDMRIQPAEIPEPACPTHSSGVINTSGTYEPGTYDGARILNKDDVYLKPGLYCIDGMMQINDGSFTSLPGGVTFFMRKPGGDWNITGGDINLAAPSTPEEVQNGSILGVLIYVQNGNTNELKIEGNGTGAYNGLIYAKDAGLYVRGTSAGDFMGQILVKYLDNSGTNEMTVRFEDNTNLGDPTYLDVIR